MDVSQLREVLAVEERYHRERGDTEVAVAIALFSNLLEGNDLLPVSEFVGRVENARNQASLSLPRPNRDRRSR